MSLYRANAQPIFGNGKALLFAAHHHVLNTLVVKLLACIAGGGNQCSDVYPPFAIKRDAYRIRLVPEHVA